MRTITQKAVNALLNAQKFKLSNTEVKILENVSILLYQNNPIAYLYNDPKRTLSIQNCGWFSNTTKERLNGLPNVKISQKNFVWYLNGKEWNGKLIDIN
jgi:hypothetical protein